VPEAVTTLSAPPAVATARVRSIDVFRGVTMFFLIAESTRIYSRLAGPAFAGTWVHTVGMQFEHHPWNGLHLWDLVQPFFMFIVGAALPFAVASRERRGESRARITRHVVIRSIVLLLLGWADYCIGPGRITYRFQDVLAQLSVTYLVAYMVMRRPASFQLGVSFGCILLTEILYRTFWVEGYNQPFVPDRNFGAWVDMHISGELSGGHWVSFNAIPTTAHTIWGVLAGQWLMSDRPAMRKVSGLAIAGVTGVALGLALTPISPIIKRICTGSFVITSGGLCLLALALCYWLVDVRRAGRWTTFFTIVGMNSLFIYLFIETGGTTWVLRIVKPFAVALAGWAGPVPGEIATSLAAWAVLWSICYWLYRRKIVITI
jgi:predicted acyltransferase